MVILLVGVSCVGKSAVGKKLAEELGCKFYDMEAEVEKSYAMTIARLLEATAGAGNFNAKCATVLQKLLEDHHGEDMVVALPPDGFEGRMFGVVKGAAARTVALDDDPENILKRIKFFDIDSKPVHKVLSGDEKKRCLDGLKADIAHYQKTYDLANDRVNISGLDIDRAAALVKNRIRSSAPTAPSARKTRPHDAERVIAYTNRKGKEYHLVVGQTSKGNPRYYFSTRDAGTPLPGLPEGYEIYENPNSFVFLRRIAPKLITDEETTLVREALVNHAPESHYRLDVRAEIIAVFQSSNVGAHRGSALPTLFASPLTNGWEENHALFTPVLRFVLNDPQKRLFIAERYCFRGSVDDWIGLTGGGPDALGPLLERFVEHLGRESFYELS